MHRYQPNIHIIVSDSTGEYVCKNTFVFPETAFMAVTAYQNHRVSNNIFRYCNSLFILDY